MTGGRTTAEGPGQVKVPAQQQRSQQSVVPGALTAPLTTLHLEHPQLDCQGLPPPPQQQQQQQQQEEAAMVCVLTLPAGSNPSAL